MTPLANPIVLRVLRHALLQNFIFWHVDEERPGRQHCQFLPEQKIRCIWL